ncbi:nitroreductase family protein [Gordonia sinesedis]
MDLDEAMTTTFAAREFTDDDLPDDVLWRILDTARFAPSGGNRQGAHITGVRDEADRRKLAEFSAPAARRYLAARAKGENPWNPVTASTVTQADLDAIAGVDAFVAPIANAPVDLVVTVDLGVLATLDKELDRIGIAGGASVYPLVWNILMQARAEGYGGTMTTMAIAAEPAVRDYFDIPDGHAVAAVVPLGKPVKQLTKLRRNPVPDFVTRDRYDGPPFEQP